MARVSTVLDRGSDLPAPAQSAKPSAPARSSVPAVLVVGALGYGALTQGAFHARQYVVFAGLCLLALGIEVAQRRTAPTSEGGVPWPAGALVAASALVSALAGGTAASALPVLSLVAVVVAGVAVAGSSPAAARATVHGLLAVAVAVAGAAWVGVAWQHEPWGKVIAGLWRGASSITYVNATAALLTMALLVSVAALVATSGRRLRLVTWALAVGLLTTMSRAGIAAALVGLVVLGVILGGRRVGAALVSVAPAVMVTVAGLVPGVAEGRTALPLVAAAALVLGAALAATGRSAVASLLLVMLLAGAGALAVQASASAGDVAERIGGTRLMLDSDDRGHEWDQAWRRVERAPLLGQGPAAAPYQWRGDDGRWYVAPFAHNEYLDLLATQGVVGLAALAGAVAIVASGWRRRPVASGSTDAQRSRGAEVRADRPLDPAWRAGAAAALVAFAVHSAFDFLWHVPLLPLAAGVLGGVGLVRHGRPPVPRADPLTTVPLADPPDDSPSNDPLPKDPT